MKKIIALVTVVFCAAGTLLAGPVTDITPNYFVYKALQYTQSSVAAPVLKAGSAYQMGTWIESSTNGAILSGTLTAPGGTGSPIIASNSGDNLGDFQGGPKFVDQPTMDAAYTSGTFTLAGQTAHGSYSVSLNVSGTYSLFSVPSLTTFTNAIWSGGDVQVSSTVAATINWTSTQGVNDKLFVQIQTQSGNIVSQIVYSGTTTSDTLPILTSGSYQAELIYLEVSGSNSSSISGATGYSGFDQSDQFTIVSVPEPSTCAMLAAGLGSLFLCRRRR